VNAESAGAQVSRSSEQPGADAKTPRIAVEELIGTVYPELRRIARALMVLERRSHTLQPTALVHEAVLRILGFRGIQIRNAEHFFFLAVGQMRQVLVSYARRKLAQKRSGVIQHNSDEAQDIESIDIEQIVVLDQVLDRLAAVDARAHQIVTLRFFGGLSAGETAAVLGISAMTVHRDWEFARSWLFGELCSKV
jgi:RNA polymerase sigma-70 factor (ECF subfamily)